MEKGDEKFPKRSGSKRLIYLLVFLVVVLPVVTGILVWKLLPDNDNCRPDSLPSVNAFDHQTTASGQKIVTTTADPFGEGPWQNSRLPKNVIPIHYDITLFPDFYDNSSWFYGNESVEMLVKESTRYILIHAHFLNITKTSLQDMNGNEIQIKRHFEYKKNEYYVVETQQMIMANSTVVLKLSFNGDMKRSIVGLYKSTYYNALTNQNRSIATSKFEPVAARRAFPCFDEPSMKATYRVTIVHKPSYIALSNMPVNISNPWSEDPTFNATEFEKSVRMSTYLVCFIVCDFDYLETTTKDNVMIRVYAPSDRVNQTQYSLDVAKTTVELYTDKFNISYPLPKLDLIAIPDFVSGAMEHWGLITFRETNILYDAKEASSANHQRVAIVVAHEVSHQWFGNLVTMTWWDNLWLNEGFATYIEYLGASKHEPSWGLLEQYVTDDFQPVMRFDSGLASHPIIVDVSEPAQINSVFDSISYSKGSAVVRMLLTWIGEKNFFQGISKYLNKHMYDNAESADLWEALGKIDNFDVKTVMASWTEQMGLPYLNVTSTSNGRGINVEQRRFLADPTASYDVSESKHGYKWFIKIDYIDNSGRKDSKWMFPNQTSVSIPLQVDLSNPNSWIKLNMNETGYYRVNYPPSIWKRLADTLADPNQTILNTIDRSNLLDDAFNLARAGMLGYDVTLNMTTYLTQEKDYLPWDTARDGFSYLSGMLEFTGDYGLLRTYIQSRVSEIYDKVGFDDSAGEHLDKYKRSRIISLACGYGYSACLNDSHRLFIDWLYNGKTIPPNLRSFVYSYGMEVSQSPADWDKMWERYKKETVPQEKSKLRAALAATRTTWLLMRYIEYAQDEDNVREQDYFTVLRYIASNPVGRGLVWTWVREHWQELVDRFGLYQRYFGRLVPAIISNFNTQYQLDEVNAFFTKYPEAGAGANGRKQALESIQRNIKWMKANKDIIVDWLKQHQELATNKQLWS